MTNKLTKAQEKEAYSKRYYCNNCGESFVKFFDFGQVAEKGNCPHCGVSDFQIKGERTGYDKTT